MNQPEGSTELETPVQFVPGVGPERAALLEKLNIRTALDLLMHVPHSVNDFTDLRPAQQLEKDLEQWFRGALLLLAATANMEHLLFGWMDKLDWMDRMDWLTMGLRLMLAISVIEAMPDQELFAVIHPGPPRIKPGRSALKEFWSK